MPFLLNSLHIFYTFKWKVVFCCLFLLNKFSLSTSLEWNLNNCFCFISFYYYYYLIIVVEFIHIRTFTFLLLKQLKHFKNCSVWRKVDLVLQHRVNNKLITDFVLFVALRNTQHFQKAATTTTKWIKQTKKHWMSVNKIFSK